MGGAPSLGPSEAATGMDSVPMTVRKSGIRSMGAANKWWLDQIEPAGSSMRENSNFGIKVHLLQSVCHDLYIMVLVISSSFSF